MRTRPHLSPFTLALLGALCAVACQDSGLGPEVDASMPRVMDGAYGGALPFQLTGGARVVAQLLAPGFPAGTSDFDGRCSAPSHFLIRFSLEATASHLGHVTGDFEHCSLVDFQTGASTLADGIAILTAANGDELWATYRSVDVPLGSFDEALTFVGGTGRFTNAVGEALADAQCDRATGMCTYEARGAIGYHAADRAAR